MSRVNEQTWRDLYESAAVFRRLAPWEWMSDSDVFGVRDPRSGEIGWCAVLGAAGQLFGLAVYLGDSGFDQHRRMHTGELGADEAVFGQDTLLCCWVDREDLDAAQIARIRALGLRFRGRGAWPQLESHAQGRVPIALSDTEAPFMLDVVQQAFRVAARFREEPRLLDRDAAGRILVLSRAAGAADWIDERVTEPEPIVEIVPQPDERKIAALRRVLPRVKARVACGFFSGTMVIDDGKAPAYSPTMFALVDGKTGAVLHFDLGHPAERASTAQRELLVAFEQLEAIPEQVDVSSTSLERALAPLAAGLGFRLENLDFIPALEEFRDGFMSFLAQNGGRF